MSGAEETGISKWVQISSTERQDLSGWPIVSRIFISHSSANNAQAIALRDWMVGEGWSDVFLDLDPERGLKAGDRWQDALKQAAHRCELVVFLISPAWTRSKWCLAEFLLAKSLNKRIFGVVVEPVSLEAMPIEMTAEWQIVDLTAGTPSYKFTVTLAAGDGPVEVAFADDGLARLRVGLRQAGLDPKYFAWPPSDDPDRPPYRGLRPLEADDAGIFFGREAPVVEAIDCLRGLSESAPPRLLAILGASGAGKSSFLRAGLLPRVARDREAFVPLPVIRPERAVISGATGLVASIAGAFEAASVKVARADIRDAMAGGASSVKALLSRLVEAERSLGTKLPTIVVAIDQGEELFRAEAQGEAQPFLALIRELLASDKPAVIAVFTIRSDNYERLQSSPELDGIHQETLSLPPMPKGSYAEVVKGPIRRLEGSKRAIKIDDALVDALLADIEAGGAKDSLPLLAFTMERLYQEYGATGQLTLDHFNKLGRVKGSIEAAVERAFAAAATDDRIPRDLSARLILLRRGLIPWLAGIDPDTNAPRRRVARLSEIPTEARPLIDLLVEQRLLSTDVAPETGETIIEPAHEALLRQWSLLRGWLSDDMGLLTVLEGVKRAARDWAANGKASTWLIHSNERLRATKIVTARQDLSSHLEPTEEEYLEACRRREDEVVARERRNKAVVASLLSCAIGISMLAYFGYLSPAFWQGVYNGATNRLADFSAKEGASRRDCRESCPEMVLVPAGAFLMGTPENDPGRQKDETPQHSVTIRSPFFVSKFEIKVSEWNSCFDAGGCSVQSRIDKGAELPVVNVSWNDAQQYIAWLSKRTGMHYRLLTEAEWEYAARAGSSTRYSWGDEVGVGNANCFNCSQNPGFALPVGSFKPNAFGLHDMHGNVWELVQDCYAPYTSANSDERAGPDKPECMRTIRGGSYNNLPEFNRAAVRLWASPTQRTDLIGLRVARSLSAWPVRK